MTQKVRKVCLDCQKPFSVESSKPWMVRCYACWQARHPPHDQQRLPQLEQEVLQLQGRNRQLQIQIMVLESKLAAVQPTTHLCSTPSIPANMLQRLIMLCHPDRHQGSEMSTKITQWLLEQR